MKGNSKPKKEITQEFKKYASQYLKSATSQLEEFITNGESAIKKIIKKCCKTGLDEEIRVLYWEIFLNVLPYDNQEGWKEIINNKRTDFLTFKSKYITPSITNFMRSTAQKGTEEYNRLFSEIKDGNKNALGLIKLDVERTFPEINLFSKVDLRENLMTVLYIHSMLNSEIGYVQGMNEICATLAYVLYPNISLNSNFCKNEITFLFFILYPGENFFECDLFIIFSELMKRDLLKWYSFNTKKYLNSYFSKLYAEDKAKLTLQDIENCAESEIKKRVYKVYYNDLALVNKELSDSVRDKVEPEQFLIRYYICLFNREFRIKDVIRLWDIILCYEFLEFTYKGSCNKAKNKIHLHFADYISLSMFDNIKKRVKEEMNTDLKNFISLIDLFMHYPKNVSVDLILKRSLELSKKLNDYNILSI